MGERMHVPSHMSGYEPDGAEHQPMSGLELPDMPGYPDRVHGQRPYPDEPGPRLFWQEASSPAIEQPSKEGES
ncbi:MAG TPA: hypothetical protein VD735_02165 [Candidatus Saccharimonadales bacterium]|nr:hypothetical protein [Candidatus Saccharimonadales bacterium]